jgi:hypothetical protein
MRQPLISRDAALFAAVFLLGNAANAPTPAIPDDPVKIGDLGKGLSRDHLPVTRAARSWFSHAKESRAGSRTSIKHSVGHDKDGTTTVFEETTFTSAPRCFVASEDGNVLHFAVATGSVDTVWRVDADGNFQVIGGEAISVQAMASAGDDAVLLLGTHLDELQAYLIAAGKDAYSPVGEAVEWTSSAAPTHLAVSASGFAFDWRSNSSRKLHRVTVWGDRHPTGTGRRARRRARDRSHHDRGAGVHRPHRRPGRTRQAPDCAGRPRAGRRLLPPLSHRRRLTVDDFPTGDD